MKRNRMMILLGTATLLLNACSGDPVRNEEYQHAESVRVLDMPPNLLAPDANLIMEFPRPSLKACSQLFEADQRFKAEEKRKQAEADAVKDTEAETAKSKASDM